jgi:anti-anti-sigma regulatory factor
MYSSSDTEQHLDTPAKSWALPAQDFAAAFPFHLVINHNSVLVQVGTLLARACPDMIPGATLGACARTVRPAMALTYEALCQRTNTVIVIESLSSRLHVRGASVHDRSCDIVFFLGTPVIQSAEDLARYGITLTDFPAHDPTADLLLLVQTQQAALNDTRRLNEKLREANQKLTYQHAAQLALQEELSRTQANLIAELSTPLIPIGSGIVVIPLIGSLDPSRLQRLMEVVLSGISETRAEIVIFDITGVPVVDADVAQHLTRIAGAARLLGADVIVTGISPEVAQSWVLIATGNHDLPTLATLERGIQFALRRQATAFRR